MKNIIFSSLLALFISQGVFSQSVKTLSIDEIARVKFSLHLINYDNLPVFDNASGEAYYNIINSSFLENLIIPELTTTTLTENDRSIIDKQIQLLNASIQNPLAWDYLMELEIQYLLWVDRTQHKQSKYKN